MDLGAANFKDNVGKALADDKLQNAMTETGPRFIYKRTKARDALPEFDALLCGYDSKARALALTGYLYGMLQREGADAARLTPALAGLDELLEFADARPELAAHKSALMAYRSRYGSRSEEG